MKIKFYAIAILSLILSFNSHAQDTVKPQQEPNHEKPQIHSNFFWGLTIVPATIKYSQKPIVINNTIIKNKDFLPENAQELRLFFGKRLDENLALIGYLGTYIAEKDNNLVASQISSNSFGFALGYRTPLGKLKKNHFYSNIGLRNDSKTAKISPNHVAGTKIDKQKHRGVELEMGVDFNFSESTNLRFGFLSAKTITGLNIGVVRNF